MGSNDWALVELYRWQHGELPPQDGTAKDLDIAKGFEAMALAMAPNTKPMPAPFNVGQVLAFAGRKIAELESLVNDPEALKLTHAMLAGVNDACWQVRAEKAEARVIELEAD